MFRAYVPVEAAPEQTGVVLVHGRDMVCLAECETLQALQDEIKDTWHSLGQIVITDPDGNLLVRR